MDKVSFDSLKIDQFEELLDYAWQNAIKYRFDPVAGRIHEEYLQLIKKMKSESKREGDNAVLNYTSK